MIDRSKFKKTSASQLVQADKELNKTMGKKEKQGNGHDIEEGANLFRIYPVHPDVAEKDERAVFAVPFVQTFLPALVQEKDKDQKPVMENGKPKMKLSVRPVVNAKVHGGYPKDLVEEYIKLANKNAKDMNLSDADRKEYMKPIYGAFSKDPSKNVNGINYPQVWIVYADKYPNANPSATPVFDEWRIKKSIKERLNKIAAIEAANDPMGTDPFTDIEEGRAVKVLKDTTTDNPQNIYTTELDNSTVTEVIGNRTVKLQKTYPLSDAQLERFLAADKLHEKYGKKLATRKNFEAQLTGLEMLDAKWEMGIFDMPEWSEVVAEIDGYYPENDAAEATTETPAEDVAEEITEESGDEFDLMDRKELQAFAKDNKTGILVKPSLNDEDLRNKLREWKTASTIEYKPLPDEEGFKADESTLKPAVISGTREEFLEEINSIPVTAKQEEEQKPATATLSAKDRLAALRAKQQATA